jgi:hypothetical protein
MPTILPSGEEVFVTPEEILKYLNSDGLRQLLRQERLHWNLKPNKDADYYSKATNYKYSGDLHNEGDHQRMEVRTFPDNGANPGYAGVAVDGGEFGLTHNREKWDHALSDESKEAISQRVEVGVSGVRADKMGYGLEGEVVEKNSHNREASMIFDSVDGRAYLLSNDEPFYVNNEERSPETRLPLRTVARIADIPTRITDLGNDFDFISDWDYHHTDNDFTHSNRYVLDNLDDRTFVSPEISKDASGSYISNNYVGLAGLSNYAEGDSTGSDGGRASNIQPEIGSNNDRQNAAVNSYNKNKNFSGNNYSNGYFPGVFKSFEELEKVDILRQKRTTLNSATPGGRRRQNYYEFDGIWAYNSYDRTASDTSYLSESHNPTNIENAIGFKPTSFNNLNQDTTFNSSMLYQWRYNRVSVYWESKNITILIADPGVDYKVGDLLRYTYTNEIITYKVNSVGPNGEILSGQYLTPDIPVRFEQDPSTNGIGVPFTDYVSGGKGATLIIACKASVYVNATQIKNNLYAYVDVVPTVRSDNTSKWSDINNPSTDNGVVVRSTAPSPAYTGVNSGRGGDAPSSLSSEHAFYEHGGNATAGPHIHIFKYVINTTDPTWEIVDGVKVYTGKWVDCGPLGLERPADIKALLFSNSDCNNFNNYYKFTLDIMLDMMNRNPDRVISNNETALSNMYIHMAESDPEPDKKFYIKRINPITSAIETVDITNKVYYINMGTRVPFVYNAGPKNDPTFGYGNTPIGWVSLVGTIGN